MNRTRRSPSSFFFAACASLLVLTPACSGKTVGAEGSDGGVDGATTADGGVDAPGGGDGSACDDFFTLLYSGSCAGYIAIPASGAARARSRFDQLCESLVALPGSNVTETGLAACVAATQTSGCWALNAGEAPCDFASGTGAASMPCVSDGQCMSACTGGSEAPDGGTLACGVCEATPGPGQSCSGLCDSGSICVNSGATGTCTPIVLGGSGAACDSQVHQCSAGLVCNRPAQTCGPPGGVGAGCASQSDCQPGLVCPSSTTCAQPGQLGASCGYDGDCVAGLGCSDSQQCATVTWVQPGQPCSATLRCLAGSCPTSGTTTGGTCPAVTPDGQPCTDESTCDEFAQCIGGTCHLSLSGICP